MNEILTNQPKVPIGNINEVRRPIMRYHGGKFLLADWIIGHFPPHRVYVEPFGGAASVLLKKERSYAEIYNDLDGEVVNLFKVCRDNGSALQEALEMTPFSRTEFLESYKQNADPLEQARRTVLRSFLGFCSAAASGRPTGFRASSNRSGTTPAHDWQNFPDALPAIINRLRGIVIENRDAIELVQYHSNEETLIYVDPPYVASTRDKGSDYRHEMNEQQHRELLDVLQESKAMIALSGYESKLYETLGWKCVKKDALADGARPRVECLYLNQLCVAKRLEAERQLCLI